MSQSVNMMPAQPFGGMAFPGHGKPPGGNAPLPMSREEMLRRGWAEVDVVFVTGDAYVDHPSFAMALLGRLLEAAGYRVGVLSQPDWRSAEAWRTFGRPRLFFAVSAGNMDSMINHYTANKKVRNDDAYSPGGEIGRRPDRATLAYCQRAREAYAGVPVIAGGVEASLRRIAHFDYWSNKVRRSILMDCKADLLAFGMGERTILELTSALDRGEPLTSLHALRGVAFRLGASVSAPAGEDVVVLPSYEEVVASKRAFADMTRKAHQETNPLNARRLVQKHGDQTIVVNPPARPLTQAEMDLVYGLPFTRKPHPSYGERRIPAFEVIRTSVQIMRGCFGGCTFCSITAHEGRIIQSRSSASVLAELRQMAADPDFKGIVSDIGGPTANMYEMRCTKPEVEAICRRQSCVHPTLCKLLGTDHGPLVQLMRQARTVPGVKKVFVASGIRMDLAQRDPAYMRELATHHVGGYLKVAPEHTDPRVLALMKKPEAEDFIAFDRAFKKASKKAGKQQYLIPYFIASHPGSDLDAMIDLAVFLKRNGYKPDQVQDFIPSPFDIAACMYYTGLDPMTMKPVHVARHMKDRGFQRALLQFFKPENYFAVRTALVRAKRTDLIGDGCDCLLPSRPPHAALDARRRQANWEWAEEAEKGPVQAGRKKARARDGARQQRTRPASEREEETVGYRPHRRSARRRSGRSR